MESHHVLYKLVNQLLYSSIYYEVGPFYWIISYDWKLLKYSLCTNLAMLLKYEPISILSVPSKILELHVHSTFYDYLESNNFITIHQSGLRHKHSCGTALIKITNAWLSSIDSANLTGLLI